MNLTYASRIALILLTAVAAFAGCSRNPEPYQLEVETVPVDGTVTLDGEPLVGMNVVFQPETERLDMRDAMGKTDEAGYFELSALTGAVAQPGAIPGKYRVLFLPPADVPPPTPQDLESETEIVGVPVKYFDAAKTPLKAEVSVDGGTIDFELTSGE